MKLFLTKISTILLALLVLLSTFSFNVDKHYCGGSLVNVSYLGKVDNCNELAGDTCITSLQEDSCCKDEIDQIQGQDNIDKMSLEKISFDKTALPIAFHIYYECLFQYVEKQTISHKYYLPPDLIIDIQLLHEVFII